MDHGFENEFYRSRWHRVLPVGPDGIQPYVRTGPRPDRIAGLRVRPAAMLRALARGLREIRDGLGAFGRWGGAQGRSPAMPGRGAGPGRPAAVRPAGPRTIVAARIRPQRLLAPAPAPGPERTETIRPGCRHHRETNAAYVGSRNQTARME
jgi:hypothetical protein